MTKCNHREGIGATDHVRGFVQLLHLSKILSSEVGWRDSLLHGSRSVQSEKPRHGCNRRNGAGRERAWRGDLHDPWHAVARVGQDARRSLGKA
jgi:hypothetical protein